MRFAFVIVLSVLLPVSLCAQDSEKTDSLILAYQQAEGIAQVKAACALFTQLEENDPESARRYLNEGLSISKELHDEAGEAEIYRHLGVYHGDRRNSDSMSYYLELASTLYEDNGNRSENYEVLMTWSRFENLDGNFRHAHTLTKRGLDIAASIGQGALLVRTLQLQASIYLDQGDYKNSIESLISARRILDTLRTPDPFKTGMVLVGIGRTEVLRDNVDAGLPYLFEGLEIFEQENDVRWKAITEMELGSAYFQKNDFGQALDHYNRSLELSYEMERDDFVSANLANIAAIYLENEQFDEALVRLFEAREINSKPGSVNNLMIINHDIASAYLGKESYPEAVDYLTRAIKLGDSIGSLDNLADAYRKRAETFEKMNEPAKALDDLRKYNVLKDSLFNATRSGQIEELKTAYETEKKEQQIALLEQEARANSLQKWLLITGLGLSVVVFGLVVYSGRQRSRRYQLERQRLQDELDYKKRELTTHALNLARKNEVLDGLKQKAIELRATENVTTGFQQMIRTIDFDLQDDKNWDNFSRYFEEVHPGFHENVREKYPEMTPNEVRLLALLKMNMSSKEIANILNISQEGIKKARYRLRKKLGISTDQSLEETVLSL